MGFYYGISRELRIRSLEFEIEIILHRVFV